MKHSTILLVLSLVLCGCGGTPRAEWVPTGEHKMGEIAQMLKAIEADSGRRPPRFAEIDAIEPFIPLGAAELRSGDIVYQWGVGLSNAGGGAVLAHEKKVESEGGWVLMQDGTVKRMTPAEFKSAPKAK